MVDRLTRLAWRGCHGRHPGQLPAAGFVVLQAAGIDVDDVACMYVDTDEGWSALWSFLIFGCRW